MEERLTYKDGANRNFVEVKKFSDEDWVISEMADGITIKFHSRAIDRLAEFEDFMEENEFADLEEVKDILDNAKTLFRIWEIVKEHYGNEVIDIVEKELKKEDEC